MQVLAPKQGGLFWRPFARDTSGQGRFPAAVRLRARLLGLNLGELTIANVDQLGAVRELRLRSPLWPVRVAGLLFEAANSLGRQASWRQLQWRLDPANRQGQRLAAALGFRPSRAAGQENVFERPVQRGESA